MVEGASHQRLRLRRVSDTVPEDSQGRRPAGMDPDLVSFLVLVGVMAAAGAVLSFVLGSPVWLVAAFFLTAVIGLVVFTRSG